MKILDIDLDFFIDKIKNCRSDNTGRLPDSEYKTWSIKKFETFLRKNCGLSKKKKINGKAIIHHDEAFHFWRYLIEKGLLETPFDVVHIDAHSDLGLGDSGYKKLMTDTLSKPIEQRADFVDLHPGNYLSYAIACRWVKSLTFVTHPKYKGDLMHYHFKDCETSTNEIQLKQCKYVDGTKTVDPMRGNTIIAYEPIVPFEIIQGEVFKDSEFDYITFAQSPGFTPEKADRLLEIARQYINEMDLGY